MITWLDPTFELTQPFFFYSVVFSILFASLTYITLKVLKVHDPQLKSILYMIPLFVPLAVFARFPPSYLMGEISFGGFPINSDILNLAKLEDLLFPRKISTEHLSIISVDHEFFAVQFLSIAGLVCITGLTVGTALLAFLYMFGSRIVCWLQGVVELTPEEKPELVAMVKRLAGSAGVSIPRIGITEDLRPNAFTIGYGKKAVMVFSLGLLKMLDGAELEAVISHEIAHIMNRDFHFIALMSALKVISFFNPLVYLLSPAITKEREVLADNTGMELIEKPETLGLALTKIWEASKGFSKGLLRRRISGFFIVSEIRDVRNLLATHPTLESRLSNIAERRFRKNTSRGEALGAFLACAVIIVMVICVCAPLTQMHIPPKDINVISLAPKGADGLVISVLPDFDLEEVAKDRVEVFPLPEKFDPGQSSSSSLHFYASATPARSHLSLPLYLSQVSGFTYSWILTSVDIAAVAAILSLSCGNNLGKAIKNRFAVR